jgi:hypothetical protein
VDSIEDLESCGCYERDYYLYAAVQQNLMVAMPLPLPLLRRVSRRHCRDMRKEMTT